MCDEAVDDSLAAFKLIPDWFFAREMIKNFKLLCTQMKIYYFNEDSDNAAFSSCRC